MRGLRLSGTEDSPISEQSTMTNIPSSSHWHGDGHAGATGLCLSWIRPYPHAAGADSHTPLATQRSRSTDSMSDCPPVCIYTYRVSCCRTLCHSVWCLFSLLSMCLLCLFRSLLLPFSSVQIFHNINLFQSQVLPLHLSSLSACIWATT